MVSIHREYTIKSRRVDSDKRFSSDLRVLGEWTDVTELHSSASPSSYLPDKLLSIGQRLGGCRIVLRRGGAILSNHEIVTVAVYLLGGESQSVDTEDVAVRASELAPGRFSWRKYPAQINLELIRVYLSDAKKPDKGAYLLGSGKEGWMLTEAGLRFAAGSSGLLGQIDLSRAAMSPKDRQWRQKERARMLASVAYAKHLSGQASSITLKEAEDFFRVDDYIVGKARERRLVRMMNAFSSDSELGELVSLMAGRLRTIGGGR